MNRHTGKVRKIFDHEKMLKEDWKNFNDELDHLINKEGLFNKYSRINSNPYQSNINSYGQTAFI
jgi:hypothetical protein